MALASPYSRTQEEASASKKVGLVISDEDWAEFQAFRERKEEYARIELNKKKYTAYEEHEKDIAMFLQNKNAFYNYMNQISSDNTESQHLTPGTEASSQGTQNLAGGEGTAAPMEQDNQDGTWQQYTRRRRRNRSDKSTSQTPTHTVVLKPVCREDVYNIASKNIRDAITKTGLPRESEKRNKGPQLSAFSMGPSAAVTGGTGSQRQRKPEGLDDRKSVAHFLAELGVYTRASSASDA
ncbi:hypothetical protein HPB47_016768 [Ixodes persulcatus]|uniref:Uncharacterized protein n=1 Tax=Ixodes persulcatus TaxID=34615 RepID=A0AC60QR30_IXOPE|nr:hypothetical protein HPB47_016768 [Ixodes persulcatus]